MSTLTEAGTSIPELEKVVLESEKHERALAAEVDAPPAKIEQAAHQHARRMADAAREGKEALASADKESEVPALRQRERTFLSPVVASVQDRDPTGSVCRACMGERKEARTEARDGYHAAEKRYNLVTARFSGHGPHRMMHVYVLDEVTV